MRYRFIVITAASLSAMVLGLLLGPVTSVYAQTGTAVAKAKTSAQSDDRSSEALAKLFELEVHAGLAKRNQTAAFDRYLSWTANRLDASAGKRQWSDKTGLARLNWIDHMLRHPVQAPQEALMFTGTMYNFSQDDEHGVEHIFTLARERLDLPAVKSTAGKVASKEPLVLLQDILTEATQQMTKAFAPLTASEKRDLHEHFYDVSTGKLKYGHTFANQKTGLRLCHLIEKMDRAALMSAGQAVLPLTRSSYLKALAKSLTTGKGRPQLVSGIEGNILDRIHTPHGDVIIGSDQANTYHLDQMKNVAVIIDQDGDDTYIEGTVGPDRPVLIIIDLKGNDTYRGEKPGIQGGAIMGVSLLIDADGNNTYTADDVAQGACLIGMGILLDMGKDTKYLGVRRVQGSAIAGVGLLIDRHGNDDYRAAMLSQGVGSSWGLGMLVDLQGDDHFYAGGLIPGSYDDSPGFAGWSQGVGTGPRGVANGGIGVLLSGTGNDIYECDYFSHGGGYWFGTGFARDFSGNDQRVGATHTNFNGSKRTVKRFLRWGIGFQAHYGVGFVIDDQGNDTYAANIAGLGFSWDIGVAGILDFQGDDTYTSPRASGAQAALGFIFDTDGNDVYKGGTQGFARDKVTYHPMPKSGGNFSFLIDYGGHNSFVKPIVDNSYNQRGAPTGFLISRPAIPTIQQIQTPAPEALKPTESQ